MGKADPQIIKKRFNYTQILAIMENHLGVQILVCSMKMAMGWKKTYSRQDCFMAELAMRANLKVVIILL